MKQLKDKFIITIDGPAGAGKTTIAKMVADKLNFAYIDTGAMYRGITLRIIEEEIPFSRVEEIEELAKRTEISIDYKNNKMNIYVDKREVTDVIRCSVVTEKSSRAAVIPGVRNRLVEIQRNMAEKHKRAVFEGRDLGSYVFPDADLKIYLDASVQERAKRRYLELKKKRLHTDLEELKKQIIARDSRDKARTLAPLKIPSEAEVIDTTNMSPKQVVKKIIALLDR